MRIQLIDSSSWTISWLAWPLCDSHEQSEDCLDPNEQSADRLDPRMQTASWFNWSSWKISSDMILMDIALVTLNSIWRLLCTQQYSTVVYFPFYLNTRTIEHHVAEFRNTSHHGKSARCCRVQKHFSPREKCQVCSRECFPSSPGNILFRR